ncbi:MAG: hypothetical protein ACXWDM_05150 [Nocardioides sp.]
MTDVLADRSAAQRRSAGADRWSVAWGTVVGVAVVMSFADLFWVVSLREAAGAVERTSHPFAEWVRESTLLVPSFVLAVLVARAVAVPRYGPAPRRAGHVAATAALVALVGTLLGVLLLAASSAYDYALESTMLHQVGGHGSCDSACLDAQQQATAELQLASVGYGSAIILVTNLLLMVWLVALAGGRLRLGRSRRPTTLRSTQVVAAGLVGAAVVHLAVVPEHVRGWPAAGVFFVVLAAAGAAVAAAVLRWPSRGPLLAAVAVCAVPLAVWLCSRTIGLPLGPEAGATEPVGLADTATAVLELAVILVAVRLFRGDRGSVPRPEMSRDAARMALVAVVAVTAWGLADSGISWLDVSAVGHAHATQ